jgi:ABC-type transport system substrate-binding protein
MRKRSLGFVVSAALMVLAACGSGGGSSQQVSGPPRSGGSVTFGLRADFLSLDPLILNNDSDQSVGNGIYDPLIARVGSKGDLGPWLADSWDPSADLKTWTLHLHQGVKFHDGTPFNADAVVFNIQRHMDPRNKSLSLSDALLIDTVKAVDDRTVAVTLKSPWVDFPQILVAPIGLMASPTAVKQEGADYGKHPVGTGPFVFKEWVPGDHFTATRNPNYWRQGLPYLDSITWKPIPDPQSRGNSLKAGNIDAMHSSDTQNVSDFMSSSSYNQVNDLNSSLGEPDQAFVMLNVAVPPLDDLRVRQALAYATDRQKYINTLGNGLTKPSDGPFIKGSPYFGTTNYPGFDQAKAKALVAEYQAAKGPISFKFGIINTAKGRQQNELLQAMWKEVGITTEIQQVEQSPYILNAIVGNYQAQGWRQFNTSDPDGNFVWWHSSTALPVGKQALNFARNKDPQIDQALITGRTNPDPAARADAYKSIAARFGADIPYIWISPAVWIVAAGTKIQGVGKGTLPDGSKARGMASGVVSAAEVWRTS